MITEVHGKQNTIFFIQERIRKDKMKSALILLLMIAPNIIAQNTDPCSSPESKQFDFWIGNWNLSWKNKQGEMETGTNSVAKILGSCVIQENFSASDGSFKGTSVSVYNPSNRKWQQTWVDNEGGYLDFTGEFMADSFDFAGDFGDGIMVLSMQSKDKDGKPNTRRMVFYNISENEFDWNWERSDDTGLKWTTLWKIHYKRRT
jgi:hypothetical protein